MSHARSDLYILDSSVRHLQEQSDRLQAMLLAQKKRVCARKDESNIMADLTPARCQCRATVGVHSTLFSDSDATLKFLLEEGRLCKMYCDLYSARAKIGMNEVSRPVST